MPYDVTLKEVAPQTVAAVRTHTSLHTIAREIAAGFGAIVTQVGAAGGSVTGAPFVVYHAVIDEQTDGDIEICMPVADVSGLGGDVERVDLPAHLVATTIHRSPYDQLSPAYHTLTGWVQEHGHQIAGAPREIYLNDRGRSRPMTS